MLAKKRQKYDDDWAAYKRRRACTFLESFDIFSFYHLVFGACRHLSASRRRLVANVCSIQPFAA
jgi:hypothetical protein